MVLLLPIFIHLGSRPNLLHILVTKSLSLQPVINGRNRKWPSDFLFPSQYLSILNTKPDKSNWRANLTDFRSPFDLLTLTVNGIQINL